MADERPKHRQIYEHLMESIVAGKYAPGDQIPTETQLQAEFAASRITVSRAVRDLARDGYLVRRRGAGSFVQASKREQQLIGLLLPGGLSGILVRISSVIGRELEASRSHLTISHLESGEPELILHEAEEACRRYVAGNVRGLIFVPLDMPREHMWVNQKIAELLTANGLSVVLLDRDVCCYPRRSGFDLVGVANRECGYVLTKYLLGLGRRRPMFVAGAWEASSISARCAGFEDALAEAGLSAGAERIQRFPNSMLGLRELLEASDADAYVCVNDHVAVHVTGTLLELGVRVPEQVAVVGIDDVDYAPLVPVPLTTLRQPLDSLGRACVRLLLDRMAEPSLPAREVSFACELIVRKSCGASLRSATVRIS